MRQSALSVFAPLIKEQVRAGLRNEEILRGFQRIGYRRCPHHMRKYIAGIRAAIEVRA